MSSITPIRAFADNYIWLIQGPDHQASLVDPGDAAPAIRWLQQQGLRLTNILLTHQHADHTGGVAELLALWPETRVYGPSEESIAGITHPLSEAMRIPIPGLKGGLEVVETPGHTKGHLSYVGESALFCGDTLFLGGCGRIFSGTHAQMAASLARLARLPAATLVYCAHEYTLANLGFGAWVEPHNPLLPQRIAAVERQLAQGQPSVPAPLQQELDTNPFLRCHLPQVIAAAEDWAGRKLTEPSAVFHALREWKDRDYD